jgi:hypothetical protein
MWQQFLGPRTVEKGFWVTTLADINEDGIVDIYDIAPVAIRFGATIGYASFSTEADINLDYVIDIYDIVKIALDYGWHY